MLFFLTLEFSVLAIDWTQIKMILKSFATMDIAIEKNKTVLLTT